MILRITDRPLTLRRDFSSFVPAQLYVGFTVGGETPWTSASSDVSSADASRPNTHPMESTPTTR